MIGAEWCSLQFELGALEAYAKAAQALRALDHAIDSGAQAKAIKGIGAGMANRIDVPWLQATHFTRHSKSYTPSLGPRRPVD